MMRSRQKSLSYIIKSKSKAHGSWTLSDEQVNSWLITQLPELLPEFSNSGMSNPRVAIQDEHVLLAGRLDMGKFSAVASMEVSLFMTDQPNQVAVRLHDARLGALPGMKHRLVKQMHDAAIRHRIPLKWSQQDNDPVALWTVGEGIKDFPSDGENLTIESIAVDGNQIRITGLYQESD